MKTKKGPKVEIFLLFFGHPVASYKIHCCFFWDTLSMTKILQSSSLDLESDPKNVRCLAFKILVTKAKKSKGRDYQYCHTTHFCWQYDNYMTIYIKTIAVSQKQLARKSASICIRQVGGWVGVAKLGSPWHRMIKVSEETLLPSERPS